jgi:arsenate reductase
MTSEKKDKVLFLCTGNQARSQMAEWLLRARSGGSIEVISAGSRPKDRVHPLAMEALADIGIEIPEARPKDVKEFLGEDFDYIITLCDNARDECPYFPGNAVRIHWSLEDPAAATGTDEERLNSFKTIRNEIARRIDEFLEDKVGDKD